MKRRSAPSITAVLAALGAAYALAGCAANPETKTKTSVSSAQAASEKALSANAAHISFHYSDYYSLSSPNSSNCAGDAKRFYDAYEISSGRPVAFGEDSYSTGSTYKPAWIKNISVDMTDANSSVSGNNAYSCSFGNSPSVPPPSSCATFDYASSGGVSSTLGGSMLLLGGIANYNYAGLPSYNFKSHVVSCGPVIPTTSISGVTGLNSCSSSMYALGIDILPASAATSPPSAVVPGLTTASGPISIWSQLSAQSGYSGPRGAAGAGIGYNPSLKQVLLFGGEAPLSGQTSSGYGGPNYETWSYSLSGQKWSYLSANAFTSSTIQLMKDTTTSGFPVQISKASGARALFGYVAVPGVSFSSASADGTVAAANIDTTDRILIVGGVTPAGISSDVHKFNPTFGPEIVDTLGRFPAGIAPATNEVTHWIDSYHTQLMSGSNSTSQYFMDYRPFGSATGSLNFGFTYGYASANKIGYLLTAGGFDPSLTTNSPSSSGGNFQVMGRRSGNETKTGNFAAVPATLAGTQSTYAAWSYVSEDLSATPDTSKQVPWYGGATMLPGFDLSKNDVVLFGGSDCRDYLTNSTLSGCSMGSTTAHRYWQLGTTIPASLPAGTTVNGSGPARAGMASARGLDASGNVIIVAWGGMQSPATTGDGAVYYLYNAGSTSPATPTWTSYTPTGIVPAPVGNAALVFSHVTRKFYLFGGYQTAGTTKTSSETWELSVSGACTGTGTCSFSWRQLNGNGMTCYPDCPGARRSHRMVEVNYNNTSPTSEPTTCTTAAPCSFGIFMEGGTPDGTNLYGDRWMLDPTANGGNGHWQRVDGFPPRRLAAMASFSYFVPSVNGYVHRTLLYGGETGLHSPSQASGTNYYVAPTLADTQIFDHSSSSWNRVELLGKGYNGGAPSTLSTFEARQAYDSTTAGLAAAKNTPPPLSGGVMVVRTFPSSPMAAGRPIKPLKIPEVYLFGGRLKDGSYLTLDNVWKFCPGSTGEIPATVSGITDNNYSVCDGYDIDNGNTSSPGPSSKYIGRWILKSPAGATTTKSFLGAAVYDPRRDKIVLFGGLSSTSAITDSSRSAGNTLYEYTPPSATTAAGSWTTVGVCSGSDTPTARYGHSMSYDQLNGQLVVVGGYNSDGAALTQTVTMRDSQTYTSPEVWVAKRDDTASTVCYSWRKITTFGNDVNIVGQSSPGAGMSHAAALYVPSDGYNTGYYSLLDSSCSGQGPIAIADPEINKQNAGGAYIDVDRAALGSSENLLLNLTFIPLGVKNQRPDGQRFGPNESGVIKVHLIKTAQSASAVQATAQPRHLAYYGNAKYPTIAQSISVVAPPTGQIRQEQIIIPLAIDPTIDRIRIERNTGSAILIDASLYRMGYR